MKPDKYIEKVIKSVEDATGNFNSGLPAIEMRILGEILTLLKDLKLKNGNIVSGTKNLRIISGVQKKIEKLVISKKYVKDLADFVSSYNTIAAHHKSFYSQFPDFKPSPYYDMVKTTAMHNTIDALTEVGIKANVLNPMRNILLTAVTSGQSYASLTDTLRKEMIGEDGKPGSLSRYASTYAVTAISQFNGQYLAAINADMGFKWYGYRGSNKTTTREFCLHMTEKEYIHESEFETILAGDIDGHECKIYEATGLPYGLIEGTTPENFIVNRGGWNCNHSLYPLPDAAVPKEIRDNVEEKVARKGGSAQESDYKRTNSAETILEELKKRDNVLRSLSVRNMKDAGETDGLGNITLNRKQYEAFNNAVDKLLNGNSTDIDANEAGAVLTYWHERTHNLSKSLLSQAKFSIAQKNAMELATEFVAQETLHEFFKMFDAELPTKINYSSRYASMTSNYQSVVTKLSDIGGISRNDAVDKVKHHIMNEYIDQKTKKPTNSWEDQRNGLVNALYGAEIDGKVVDRRKLGSLVDSAIRCSDHQFKQRINKLLELIN